MKKLNIVLFGLLLICSTAFFSCKKDTNACSTCYVKNGDGVEIKNYGEKCGTTEDVDNYEASSKSDGDQLGGTFTCDRK